MKGYKAFNNDLTCRGYQYEIGKTYEMKDKPILCEKGFHFCENIADIFNYYNLNEKETRVCEVEALGDIEKDDEDSKRATNKIKIIREITWKELKEKYKDKEAGGWFNTGYRNTGNYNTGNYNTGYRNTGDCNTGYRNTGNYNTGNYNTGYRNTGNYNTGNYNTGNYNTGDCNTGNYNTGDCNTGDCNTGLFNTNEPNARLFNKMSDIKMSDINTYRINDILLFIDKREIKLVYKYEDEMTDQEKIDYPEYKTIGGALMKERVKVDVQAEWEKVDEEDKDFIMSLPNFDAGIFYECTGIKV